MDDKYHSAARDGYLDILRNGNRKEMNSPDEDGRTPPMLAAESGNLDALRMTIMRAGDPNKMDLMGYTAMHHAAKNGHMNCIRFLVNFGANVWSMDNDHHTAMDIAALENREDIVKFLDDTQTSQIRKSPKIVQGLKEKALKEAEKNAKYYEKMQDKASRDLAKSRRKIEAQQNGDFRAPSESSFVKKLTLRMKGTNKLKNIKNTNGTVSAFSDLVNANSKSGTTRKGTHRGMPETAMTEFRESEFDNSGKRTIKSLKGTIVSKDAQVLYVTNRESTDNSLRPALTNVFQGTSLDDKTWNKTKKDNLTDSGNDSFDSALAEDDDAPGIFNRPNFGQIAFMKRMDHLNTFKAVDIPLDEDVIQENGFDDDNLDGASEHRNSSGTDSLGTHGSAGESHDLPWKPEEVEFDSDDDEENEYSPVIVFLESCGLTHYTKLFTDNDVDMNALMILTNQDFQDMGLPIGPRRKLMDAIQRRRVVLTEPAQMYDSQL